MNPKFIPDYRPDIDGLRALAVLSVLLFHAFPHLLPGGFAGVDVFFVISGYLITGIIWRENKENRFSLSSFYARRVRRIFPALILVLCACLLTGWLLLFDDEFKQLGKHAARAGIFVSNFVLWREAGYFDARAELKPLLHLWSLAIEEQFYIIWPGLIMLVYRWCRNPIICLCGLLLASFGWNIYQYINNPIHDFYSPLTRFWELIAGALLAVKILKSPLKIALPQKRLLAWVGFVLILSAALFLGHAVNYPGAWAVWPVLGALCFIAAEGGAGTLHTLMTNRLALWIGEISYALYLWHWPILSFLRIVEGKTPDFSIRLMGVVLSFLLSILTVYYVEKHFRYGSVQRAKIKKLLLAMVIVILFGHIINKSEGFPQRELMQPAHTVHAGPIGHDSLFVELKQRFYPCSNPRIMQGSDDLLGMKRCFQSKAKGSIDYLLLGDSHAEHLFIGLADALPDMQVAYHQQNGLPLLSNPRFSMIFEELLSDKNAATILIAAKWHSRMKELSTEKSLVDELSKTIQALQASGKKVVLLDDVYQFEFDPPRCKYGRPLAGGTTCSASIDLAKTQHALYWPVLTAVSARVQGVRVLRISDALCTESACSMLVGNSMAYRDSDHLSSIGAQMVAQRLLPQLFLNY